VRGERGEKRFGSREGRGLHRQIITKEGTLKEEGGGMPAMSWRMWNAEVRMVRARAQAQARSCSLSPGTPDCRTPDQVS
jgi:hypothetical protein